MRKKRTIDDVENSLRDILNRVTSAESEEDREAAKRSFEQAMVALWRSVRIVSNTASIEQQTIMKGAEDSDD